MYVGYIIGIFISFNVAKIVNLSKTASNAIFIGIIIYIISLGFLTIESFYAIFASMLVFYAGSFTAHSVATAHVNKKATSHKGITNGLYVSFYYAGGALGSFVPGVIYEFGGWNMFLSALAILLCVSLFFIWKLKKGLCQIHSNTTNLFVAKHVESLMHIQLKFKAEKVMF